MTSISRDYLQSDENKEKRIAAIRKRWADPEFKEQQLARMHSPEARKKLSDATKAYHRKLKDTNETESKND